MSAALKMHGGASDIINAGIRAEDNVEGETLGQKKERQDKFQKKWSSQFGPAFLQSAPAKFLAAGLQIFAGASLLVAFPVGAVHAVAMGLLALGGIGAVAETRETFEKLAHCQKQAGNKAPEKAAESVNNGQASPTATPQPKSSLTEKAATSAFTDAAQKPVPANENALVDEKKPAEPAAQQEKASPTPKIKH